MSIVGYWRSISANSSPIDVDSFMVLSMDCPRELVELVSRTLPLVFSRGSCGVSEVAADVKTDGASAGSSSSLGILIGFATGRFFLGNFDRRGP